MSTYDLNLLIALHILLSEGSVSAAARRLHLSNSAMSRTLSRIRDAFGDPILIRAGRSLVPTPRALELKERLRPLLDQAEALRRQASAPDLRQLDREFTIRANEGFIIEHGTTLLNAIANEAPNVLLHFAVKAKKDAKALREGRIDLDIDVLGHSSPEIRCQTLLRDRFVGVTAPPPPRTVVGGTGDGRAIRYPTTYRRFTAWHSGGPHRRCPPHDQFSA